MTVLAADAAIYGSGRADDEARVRQAFSELDVNVRVRTATYGEDPGLSWVLIVSVSTRLLFENMAQRAEVALQIRELTRRTLLRGADARGGLLLLQDTETGVAIVLAPNLPDAAFRSLPAVDLLQFTFGPLHYDPAEGAWRSLFDERSPR
jgi:hypothetical protein